MSEIIQKLINSEHATDVSTISLMFLQPSFFPPLSCTLWENMTDISVLFVQKLLSLVTASFLLHCIPCLTVLLTRKNKISLMFSTSLMPCQLIAEFQEHSSGRKTPLQLIQTTIACGIPDVAMALPQHLGISGWKNNKEKAPQNYFLDFYLMRTNEGCFLLSW